MSTPVPSASWWLDPEPAAASVDRDAAAGLSTDEAKARLATVGPNRLVTKADRAWWRQLLERFRNPLVILLLVASLLSGLSGELTNALIIALMVISSMTLDFIQERRASDAAARLGQSVSLRARIRRAGQVSEIPALEVVPGDIVLLAAGDLVPADGRLLEAKDFFVNQVFLTGESFPIEKHCGALPASAGELQEATNAVFMGTTVVSGSAVARVMQTGARTAIGTIAGALVQPAPPNAFEIGTRRFGALILHITLWLVAFVLIVNLARHRPVLESLMFAIALAVGLTPELLPMVVSLTLSRGALQLATRRVIVKHLPSIQNLGSMDILCTDKTGTLTEARIALERHVDPQGRSSARSLELVYLNSFFETGLKSALDEAVLEKTGVDTSPWKKIDEVPFDFERRRVSVLLDKGQGRLLIVKGAPEDMLALCTHYEEQGNTAQLALDDTARKAIHGVRIALETEGFRVLGIAWREVPADHSDAVIGDETELVFAGFAAFLDPPKTSARAALSALRDSGVTVKILTGDSELVTQHVCAQLSIEVVGLLTGKDIASLDDATLQSRAEHTNLFCRVNPAQKERIILALKRGGHVVGYLGDGINDAPSLHSADVGLSVDSAVDVAKAAADMILLDQDLMVVHAGVLEGRRTFGNIMKYIMMGTSSSFGNMFSMAGASLFLPFLPMLPTQILLNNLLYDVSEAAIPLDRVDEAELRRPRVLDMRFIRNFMLVLGPISSIFDFLTFYLLMTVMHADEHLFQTGWFVESICTQVLVIFLIRTRGNPLLSRPDPVLAFSSLAVVACGALLPFTALGGYFGLTPPPLSFYAMLAGVLLVYLGTVEVAKRLFYRWYRGPGGEAHDLAAGTPAGHAAAETH